MQNNNTDISEIIGADFNKKARTYQKDREKEQSSEYLQWQKEAAVYLRISSEMQKDGFSLNEFVIAICAFISGEPFPDPEREQQLQNSR